MSQSPAGEAAAVPPAGSVARPPAGHAAGPPAELAEELAEADARLAVAPAGQVVEWAVDRFGQDLVLAASFQDVVLVDLAVRADPAVEVVFCDTEAHFEETLAFVDEVRARFGLNLTVTRPGPDAAAVPCGADGCCELRKVMPLRRALDGKQAWLTSLKRVDAPTRVSAPVVGWDATFGLVKVNPLATWTDADVDGYLADHGLPVHPLVSRGYLSIGCAPTTRPVAEGEDRRAGRWAGTGKTECGLHA
ncbi:MAG: phosphoadenylyl-sulfate reductase [Acidimicrobiales bacterium]